MKFSFIEAWKYEREILQNGDEIKIRAISEHMRV